LLNEGTRTLGTGVDLVLEIACWRSNLSRMVAWLSRYAMATPKKATAIAAIAIAARTLIAIANTQGIATAHFPVKSNLLIGSAG